MIKNSSMKQRREERIQELLDVSPQFKKLPVSPVATVRSYDPQDQLSYEYSEYQERDPEALWKKEHGRWGGIEEENNKHSFVSGFIWRIIVSCVLFGMIWGVFRTHQSWALPIQHYITQSLNREMNFQATEAWYVAHFGGAPSFIPIFNSEAETPQKMNASLSLVQPIEGNIVQSYALSLKGIEIAPTGDSNMALQVKSVATGLVLEVSDDSLTGRTVTIRHGGGIVSIYGHLSNTELKVNDWLEAGDIVGQLPNRANGQLSNLYFAVKQDNTYIDPAEVIHLD
ncbi:stage IV sporulation protein FA [Paenibacillus sp. DS2015]|uniref:peptidoglycan DD-metalloendopeptidase family protein n=1 Tax=Paenibacillus sp. DS2015 TaxID=3373917 RepID=UPI003D22BEEF